MVFVVKMLLFFVFFVLFGLFVCFGFNNVYYLNEWDFESYIWDKDLMFVDFFVLW